jgi:hypothetical protein
MRSPPTPADARNDADLPADDVRPGTAADRAPDFETCGGLKSALPGWRPRRAGEFPGRAGDLHD